MDKPRPDKQNIQIKGETLLKIENLRDAAHEQGLKKSYPDVVADAMNLFYDVSVGARSGKMLEELAEERAWALGMACMNILVTVIKSGQNVKECECIYQPAVDAIGITLPNGYNILMPAMSADPSRVFFHTKDMLIRSGIAKQEAGADGPISTIDLDRLLGQPMEKDHAEVSENQSQNAGNPGVVELSSRGRELRI